MFKNIFTIAVALVFLVTTLMWIVGAGQLIDIGLQKVLGVESCSYEYREVLKAAGTTPEYVCQEDTNRRNRDIAKGLSLVLASFPFSILAYRRMRR